ATTPGRCPRRTTRRRTRAHSRSSSSDPRPPSPAVHSPTGKGSSMKVFVTGANGYLGRAVCTRFQLAGHEVQGLARSRVAAATLRAWGITPVEGSLDDTERL